MSKVTKKFQVSVPKSLAKKYGIQPGDDLHWEAAGETLRVVPVDKQIARFDTSDRLTLFDEATKRQQERELERPVNETTDRGWTRDSLYKGNAGAD